MKPVAQLGHQAVAAAVAQAAATGSKFLGHLQGLGKCLEVGEAGTPKYAEKKLVIIGIFQLQCHSFNCERQK